MIADAHVRGCWQHRNGIMENNIDPVLVVFCFF